MKLLLDENLPKRLKRDLAPHTVLTVRDMGWNGKSNGELLSLMRAEGFHALCTFDKYMEYQQNFKLYDLPVFVLDAEDNTYLSLAPLAAKVKTLLEEPLGPGPVLVK